MAAADIQDRKADLTTCSICFETFRVPKHFPCLHSFCEKCVHTYITSTFQKRETNNGVTCPVCRVFVKKPEDISEEEWARYLPVNHLLVSLIDINESMSGAKVCNACARENKTENAEMWCLNCIEALCKECVRAHRKNKASAFHKITNIDDGNFSLQSADIFCPEHPDKKQEAYCHDHSIVCCMSCVMLKHRKCDNVGSVEEAAKSLKNSEKIVNLEKSLTETKGVMEILIQTRIDNMKRNETTLGDMKAGVEKFFRELSNHLEQLKAQSLLQIAAVEKEVQLDLESERDELQCKMSAVENDLSLYHSHMKYSPPAHFLQAMERLSKQSADLKDFVRHQKRKLKEVNIRFEQNEKLGEIPQIKQLGDVKIEKTQLKNIGHLGTEALDMLTATIMLVMEKDEADHVQGLAIINDDFILVSKNEGRCLELWDNTCKMLSSLSVSGRPYGIKMISETKGMVAINRSMLTAFEIKGTEIMKTKDINIPVDRDFISHNEKYFISCGNKIVVHDSCHNYERDIAVSGIRYLAARDDSTLLYSKDNELHFITMDGAPVFKYSHDKLQGATGVTVDNTGYIYVCGYYSKNVHQLNNDGKLQRIIFDNLPTEPNCIEFNYQGDKAVVVGSRKVLVYDIK